MMDVVSESQVILYVRLPPARARHIGRPPWTDITDDIVCYSAMMCSYQGVNNLPLCLLFASRRQTSRHLLASSATLLTTERQVGISTNDIKTVRVSRSNACSSECDLLTVMRLMQVSSLVDSLGFRYLVRSQFHVMLRPSFDVLGAATAWEVVRGREKRRT